MLFAHQLFWRQHPAFLYGLCFLIGSGSILYWESPWIWIWPLLWTLYLCFIKSYLPILLLIVSSLYAHFLYPSPSFQSDRYYFSVNTLKMQETPFHKGYLYSGWLYQKNTKIPCSMYYRGKGRPKANCDYIVKGQLLKKGPYAYVFRPEQWSRVEKSWSGAEWRFQLKNRFRSFLVKKLPRSGSFLTSLVTGESDDRLRRFEFGRLGLSHILAVSGFHFGVLLAFCSFFLQFFLPRRAQWAALMILSTAYFLFIGTMPAVQRAWIAVLLYLLGRWLGRHASGLNLLGTALLIELLLDPLMSSNLGFQLSFTCSAGILLLHPLIEKQIRTVLPKRTGSELYQLPLLSKHAYVLSAFLRHSFSLTLAVNLTTLPILLYHFHQFPLLGLLYNLFFPFLVGIAISLLFLSFLAPFLFPLTDFYTAQLLDMVSNPPPVLDYVISVTHFPAWIIPIYLFALTNTCLFAKMEPSLRRS